MAGEASGKSLFVNYTIIYGFIKYKNVIIKKFKPAVIIFLIIVNCFCRQRSRALKDLKIFPDS